MTTYTPPPGDAVPLDFVGGPYTPPAGNAVPLEFRRGAVVGDDQYLFPSAWLSFEPGVATTWNWIQYIAPSGLDSFTAGTAGVETGPNFTQYVAVLGADHGAFGDFTTQQNGEFPVLPAGWHTEAFGEPWASLWHQFVEPEGVEHTRFGTAEIYIPPPQFVMASGKDSMVFGTAFVAWQLRWVWHIGHGHLSQATGTPRVTHRVQTVQVPWSVFTQYGNARVSRQIEFGPEGWDGAAAGKPKVEHGNVIYPAGWASSEPPPLPWLSHSPRRLWHVQSVPSTEWGTPGVFLWVRYLQHSGFPAETQGAQFGTYTHIFNRNREVAPYGFVATRMSITNAVRNAARALLALPMEETRWGADTFIAPGVRRVYPQGLNGFRASNFGTAIYNAAMQLRPSGWLSGGAGRPEWIESNLQTVRHHSGPTTEFGLPFVAPAVRTVSQYGWLSASHRMGYPRVWFNRLRPAGFDAAGFGAPALFGPFIRTIGPRWVHRDLVGHPDVRNVTPQIYPPGRPYSEFGGQSWVSFRVRTLSPGGIWEFAIGRPAIRDRTHYPSVRGWDSFISSPFAHQVRNVDPDPPSTRIVSPTSIYTSDEENWRQFYSAYIGKPTVGANVIWPEGIWSQRFGNADLRRQGALVEMHAPMTRWGDYFDTRVEHKNRELLPEGIPRKDILFGKPRLSPYTIWAPLGAPQQAVLNHPTSNPLHAVGGREPAGYADSRWPWFGHTHVANRVRQIVQYHDIDSEAVGKPKFGEATVVEWRQRIRLLDHGIDSQRFGGTVLHPHTKRIWGIGLLSQSFGNHAVELGDKRQWVRNAGGIYGTLSGEAFLWGGLRYVFAHGSAHTAWGNNNPMVHYPRRFEIGGGALTKWGDTWVSHRVRHLFPEGFEATEADWVDFRARMRVMHRHRPAVAGFNALQIGRPTINLKQQIISPYMIPPPGMCSLGLVVHHG